MNKFVRSSAAWMAACAFVMTGTAFAASKGNAENGKAMSAMCAGCHGDDGNSFVGDFPRLAGQYGDYIAKQIADFQKGHRANNDTMAGMAATVASVQDAKDLGAYFESQKMSKDPLMPVDKKLAKKGEKLFNEGNPRSGVYGCVNCHGKNGKGKSASISTFPVLGGQHKDYLVKQLKDFRSGTRANDPGLMMTDIAKKLTDEEIEAVANYLAGQL